MSNLNTIIKLKIEDIDNSISDSKIPDESIIYAVQSSCTIIPDSGHKTQNKLKKFLDDNYSYLILTEKRFDWCKDKNPLPFDFYIPDLSLIIELDGPQHFEQVSNWDSPEEIQDRDYYKMTEANKRGYSVIRILQEDVWNDKNNWVENLKKVIMKYDIPTNIFIGQLYMKIEKFKQLHSISSSNTSIISNVTVSEFEGYTMCVFEYMKNYNIDTNKVDITISDEKRFDKISKYKSQNRYMVFNLSLFDNIYYVYQCLIYLEELFSYYDNNYLIYHIDEWVIISEEIAIEKFKSTWFGILHYIDDNNKVSELQSITVKSLKFWKDDSSNIRSFIIKIFCLFGEKRMSTIKNNSKNKFKTLNQRLEIELYNCTKTIVESSKGRKLKISPCDIYDLFYNIKFRKDQRYLLEDDMYEKLFYGSHVYSLIMSKFLKDNFLSTKNESDSVSENEVYKLHDDWRDSNEIRTRIDYKVFRECMKINNINFKTIDGNIVYYGIKYIEVDT